MRVSTSSGKWLLTHTDPFPQEVAQELLGVPGLWVKGQVAGGPVDAVAAAATRVGLQAPAMITTTSVGIDGLAMREYQMRGTGWLVATVRQYGRALLADEMGLGKTRTSIAAALYLGGKVLVICPAFVRETWKDELAKCGVTNVAVCRPTASKRQREKWDGEAKTSKFVITSYELAERALEQAFGEHTPTTVLIDEAHYLCGFATGGRTNKRQRAVQAAVSSASYAIALTGTPLYDRPRDAYGLFRSLGILRCSASAFGFAYCAGSINAHGGLDAKGVSRPEELKLRLSYYMLRRQKSEVAQELPALTRQVMWVDPVPEATKAYQRMQIGLDGAALQGALEATLDAKIPVAVELARNAKRFLLFTWMKRHAKEMHRQLNESDTPCVYVDGEMATEKRHAQCKLAEEKGWGVVATIDSLWAGVNLQGVASTGIMHAIPWVPAKALQAEKRLHRLGIVQPVQWIYLAMRDSADVSVVRTVVSKLTQLASVLGQELDAGGLKISLDEAVNVPAQAEDDALAAIFADCQGQKVTDDES